MSFKDIAGQELAVGDTVALSKVGYRKFQLGTIKRFTPKGMQVAVTKKNYKDELVEELTYRSWDMVCKVVKQ